VLHVNEKENQMSIGCQAKGGGIAGNFQIKGVSGVD